ncbi:hypothetical protein Esti_002839 [Eimeria stiedai]
MKLASEEGDFLLQSVSLNKTASGRLQIPRIRDDARRQKTLKHSTLALVLSVLVTVTLVMICYRSNRVHIGSMDRERSLAAGWPGQESDDEEQSKILDSCLDLESELALSTQRLNPLQSEEEAIEALTLNLLAEAEYFESGTEGARSSFFAMKVFQDASSEPSGVRSQEHVFPTPSSNPAAAFNLYSQQSSWSYQRVDSTLHQPQPCRVSPNHFSQGATPFTSDPRGRGVGHSSHSASAAPTTASPSFWRLPGLTDLSRLTAGRKEPLDVAEGGSANVPIQKRRKTESEREERGTRHYSDVGNDGRVVQSQRSSSTTGSQPLSVAIEHKPDGLYSEQVARPLGYTLQEPHFSYSKIKHFFWLPPNPRLLEAGATMLAEVLQDLEGDAGLRRSGFVSITLQSGEEIQVPHPPPPLEPGCHEFYRLPRPELTSLQVENLCKLSQELVNYMFVHHRTPLETVWPSRAANQLAIRFLCFEGLVCAIETLGPAMNAQQWFPMLVEAVPTDYVHPSGEILTRALYYSSFSVQISHALRQLKKGVRPSPEETLKLMRNLFDKQTAPSVLRSPRWNFGREEFQHPCDSS